MTGRIAFAVIVAACLFAAGYALADPKTHPVGGGVTSDVTPRELRLRPVEVRAGLRGGTPARLRPAPVRRPPRRVAAPVPRVATPVVRRPVVRAPRPRRVSAPAPRAVQPPPRPVSTPAPRPAPAPKPKPAPTPKPPSYVGSGFDDSG